MRTATKDRWEDFHQDKSANAMALEWPDEYVVRFAKGWLRKNGIREVLDMNCGAGRHTALLAELGFDPLGYDISETALDLARALVKKRGLHARFQQGSSDELPFPTASFDALVAWRSLHVFAPDQLPHVVAEMRRVVRPRGKILFSTRSDRNIYREEAIGRRVPRPNDLALDELKALCADLTIEQIELSEATSENRTLRDSYWVVLATR